MTSPWPHDDTQSLIAFYGDPREASWSGENLVQVTPPWKMLLAWDTAHPIQHFAFHTKCKDSLDRVFANLWQHYGQDQAAIEHVGLHLWGGAYNYRPIRGSSRLSCHAFGAAIDMDPDHNGMNTAHISHLDPAIVAAFKAEQFFWGGDFHSRQDPMHFQAAHE